MNKVCIVTGNGDNGRTKLGDGTDVPKWDPRVEAVGDLDELNSVMGVLRAHLGKENEKTALIEELQAQLIHVMSEVSGAMDALRRCDRMDAGKVKAMTQRCRDLERGAKVTREFVPPGETPEEAYWDLARSVTRRCERRVAALAEQALFDNEHIVPWLNRLSDYLWLLGHDQAWSPNKFRSLYPLNLRR